MEDQQVLMEFKDLLPAMAARVGPKGLLQELFRGFRMLVDSRKGVITVESLKRNAGRLGLEDEEVVEEMVKGGDMDGDGALNFMEFCVLMVRLSPELMVMMKESGSYLN